MVLLQNKSFYKDVNEDYYFEIDILAWWFKKKNLSNFQLASQTFVLFMLYNSPRLSESCHCAVYL